MIAHPRFSIDNPIFKIFCCLKTGRVLGVIASGGAKGRSGAKPEVSACDFHASNLFCFACRAIIAYHRFNVNNYFEKNYYIFHVLPFAQEFVVVFGNYLQV
jgi:hypothetical protein